MNTIEKYAREISVAIKDDGGLAGVVRVVRDLLYKAQRTGRKESVVLVQDALDITTWLYDEVRSGKPGAKWRSK